MDLLRAARPQHVGCPAGHHDPFSQDSSEKGRRPDGKAESPQNRLNGTFLKKSWCFIQETLLSCMSI